MGGLMVGRVITEHPEPFAGAHLAVGDVNPLRARAATNGAAQINGVGSTLSQEVAERVAVFSFFFAVPGEPDVQAKTS